MADASVAESVAGRILITFDPGAWVVLMTLPTEQVFASIATGGSTITP
jgi:hypothetical protein